MCLVAILRSGRDLTVWVESVSDVTKRKTCLRTCLCFQMQVKVQAIVPVRMRSNQQKQQQMTINNKTCIIKLRTGELAVTICEMIHCFVHFSRNTAVTLMCKYVGQASISSRSSIFNL